YKRPGHDDVIISNFYFFQAEDGIRDFHVTGVQTCALPISRRREVPAIGRLPRRTAPAPHRQALQAPAQGRVLGRPRQPHHLTAGDRKSVCRERVWISVFSSSM